VSRPRSLLLVVAAAAAPGLAAAQLGPTVVRSGVYFESYSFGQGLAFSRISEFTIPIGITQRIGQRLVIDVATAYASATTDQPGGTTTEHSGLVDTDIRATVSVLPGRLLLNVVGTLPTGVATVSDTTIPLFGATATDLLAFTTPSFGAGGAISTGFASAFRMGSHWAIGTGGSYRAGASYVPVRGGNSLSPGGEIRARLGVEGPFGEGKYFRGALVYTRTADNDIGGGEQSAIGDRALLYAAVSLPLGSSHLSIYGWDMYRLRASNFDAPATIAVPRGNVFALGARLERGLSPRVTLVPLLEVRHELTGPAEKMKLLGYLVRGGADVRYRLSDRATGVLHAQLAAGTIQDEGVRASVVGPRVGVLIEWSR
jgi:hypothetical protein